MYQHPGQEQGSVVEWVDFLSTCWFGTGLTGRLHKQQWQNKPKKSGSNYSWDFGRPKSSFPIAKMMTIIFRDDCFFLVFHFICYFQTNVILPWHKPISPNEMMIGDEQLEEYKWTQGKTQLHWCLFKVGQSLWCWPQYVELKEFKIWLNAIENYHKYAMSSYQVRHFDDNMYRMSLAWLS